MLREQKAVLELMGNLVLGRMKDISKVEYLPQKPAFRQDGSVDMLPRRTAESEGISSEMLADMIEDLKSSRTGDIHQFMVLRNGAVICECSFAPYKRGIWHITHSLCKSITGMAVGMLIGEGKLSLDDHIVDIFKEKQNLFAMLRQKDITVRHLLTMTSGVSFNETGAVAGNDWVKSYLEAGVRFTPGSRFEYNSMNSYMLSAIITEITGLSMMEYLRPRLWEPLGIQNVFWEACPQGITKGGWGLFLRPEDAARLGQLYLDKGRYKDRQLVPEEWIEESVKKQTDTGDESQPYGYGYQVWPGKREGSFNFNGMLGQNVLVYPDLQMVVVTNAGSSELFQDGSIMDTVNRYMCALQVPSGSLPPNVRARQRLEAVIHRMENPAYKGRQTAAGGWRGRQPSAKCRKENWRLPNAAVNDGRGKQAELQKRLLEELDQKTYLLGNDSVGFFPLMMQVFHNNYTEGIKKVRFAAEKGRLWMYFTEGEEEKTVEIGMGETRITEVEEHGEPYLTAVTAEAAEDEDGRLVLKLDAAFLEEAARRKIKIFLDEGKLELRFNETPGKDVILSSIQGIMQEAGSKLKLSEKKDGKGLKLVQRVIESSIAPIIYGKEETVQAAEEESVENKARGDEDIGESEQGEAD